MGHVHLLGDPDSAGFSKHTQIFAIAQKGMFKDREGKGHDECGLQTD